MKTWFPIGFLAATLFAPLALQAAGAGVELDAMSADHSDKSSLQRGARTFVNYCMGCHSASYHRYSRLGSDLGIPDELVEDNLIFTHNAKGERDKVGDPMVNAMSDDYARTVFGVAPPNLALISRSRGTDWLYTYMRSFYRDDSRGGIGANNTVYPKVAMPHVLWELQGWQQPVFETVVDQDGQERQHLVKLSSASGGALSTAEYDALIYDLVNFLDYLGDPIKQKRHQIGFWVMIFLSLFLVFTFYLKREYWRDIK